MITKDSLKEDFRNLGIKEGDTLFLRISYKAVGKIEGGPMVFLEALHEVIGEEGTIILTAFPYLHTKQYYFFHKKIITSKNKPAKPRTGILPVFALTYPNAKISEKLEFPFVVIGKHSGYLTTMHTHDKDPYWLLEEAIEKLNCKCLRVGGKEFTGSTHVALTRVLVKTGNYQRNISKGIYVKEGEEIKWYDAKGSVFCYNAFLLRSKEYVWNHVSRRESKVGNGIAVLTDMRETLYYEEDYMNNDIKNLLCNDPDCFTCRISYSFSDDTKFNFFFKEFKKLFTTEKKKAIRNLYSMMINILFGENQK